MHVITNLTCSRIRRIKCDEKKPHCNHCLRGRRTCDGYSHVNPKHQQTSPRSIPDSASSSNSSPSPPQSLSTSPFSSPLENRHFEFFITRTIHTLSSSFQSSLFPQSILQAAHHESAIRHSVIALAALHESFENREFGYGCKDSWRENAFALGHYVKAIQCLVSPCGVRSEREVAGVAVVSCVLFVSFEVSVSFAPHLDIGDDMLIRGDIGTERISRSSSISHRWWYQTSPIIENKSKYFRRHILRRRTSLHKTRPTSKSNLLR
jgi:hypothetical protein